MVHQHKSLQGWQTVSIVLRKVIQKSANNKNNDITLPYGSFTTVYMLDSVYCLVKGNSKFWQKQKQYYYSTFLWCKKTTVRLTLTRPQSSSGHTGETAQGEMGTEKGREEKTKEEDDWEILSRKVVPRVKKLCKAVLATFFTIDWLSVFSLLYGWFSFIWLVRVSILSWIGISSKNHMVSSGGDDSTCEGANLKELNNSIHELSIHGKFWNDKKLIFMVYIKIKIQFSQSKDSESRLY